jgi:hypothetical protein
MAEVSRKGKRKVNFNKDDQVRTIPPEKRAHRDADADDDMDGLTAGMLPPYNPANPLTLTVNSPKASSSSRGNANAHT